MNSSTLSAAPLEIASSSQESNFIDYNSIKKSSLILRALNHKLRQQIITLIHNNPGISVTDIYGKLKIEQSVASQHLALLRHAGVLLTNRKGKFIFYSLDYKRINSINTYSREL